MATAPFPLRLDECLRQLIVPGSHGHIRIRRNSEHGLEPIVLEDATRVIPWPVIAVLAGAIEVAAILILILFIIG